MAFRPPAFCVAYFRAPPRRIASRAARAQSSHASQPLAERRRALIYVRRTRLAGTALGQSVITDPLFYLLAIPAVTLLGLGKGGFAGLGMIATPLLALVVPPLEGAAILLAAPDRPGCDLGLDLSARLERVESESAACRAPSSAWAGGRCLRGSSPMPRSN